MRFELPKVELPYTARMHPHVDRIRDRTRGWVRDKGFLDLGVWTTEAFEAADYGLFTALTHPHASAGTVDLVTDWRNWFWFVDDYVVETFKRTKNVVGLKAFVTRLKTLEQPVDPIEEALAELRERSGEVLSQAALDDLFDSWLWELSNDVQARVPDPVDFVEMRRQTVGTAFTLELLQHATGAALPAELRGTRELKAVADIFGDVTGLYNDLVSFEKDVIGEGTGNNAVLAVQDFFGGDLQSAANVVADLIAARVRELRELAAQLPAAADFIEASQSWLAGYVTWADRTGRYRVSATPKRITFHHPSGLGTAAVLVR